MISNLWSRKKKKRNMSFILEILCWGFFLYSFRSLLHDAAIACALWWLIGWWFILYMHFVFWKHVILTGKGYGWISEFSFHFQKSLAVFGLEKVIKPLLAWLCHLQNCPFPLLLVMRLYVILSGGKKKVHKICLWCCCAQCGGCFGQGRQRI